ncbi:MAG TPA: TA system VapC family ribonuclease toxin [Chloroflexota bacterium]|nr:TA system VapC family ribonuclease toxin [Chloroflexota bacterium]
MVVVDANVLLYAVNESAPNHRRAKRWLEAALNGTEPVGFAWLVLLAFTRLSTLRSLFPTPLETTAALDLVDAWLAAPAAVTIEPTSRHATLLRKLLAQIGTAGNLVNDAHLAALAAEHKAAICTFDADFSRFTGVKSFAPQ